jgi:hypothetical protein
MIFNTRSYVSSRVFGSFSRIPRTSDRAPQSLYLTVYPLEPVRGVRRGPTEHEEVRIHSIHASKNLFDNRLLTLLPPLLHLLIRRHDGADVVCDKNILPSFLVRRNRMKGQRFELSRDVDLRPTLLVTHKIRKLQEIEILRERSEGLPVVG